MMNATAMNPPGNIQDIFLIPMQIVVWLVFGGMISWFLYEAESKYSVKKKKEENESK